MQPALTICLVLVSAVAGSIDTGCSADLAGCDATVLEDRTSLVQATMYLSRKAPKADGGGDTVVMDSHLGPDIANILTGKDEGMAMIPAQPAVKVATPELLAQKIVQVPPQTPPQVQQPPPPSAVQQVPPQVQQPLPQQVPQVQQPVPPRQQAVPQVQPPVPQVQLNVKAVPVARTEPDAVEEEEDDFVSEKSKAEMLTSKAQMLTSKAEEALAKVAHLDEEQVTVSDDDLDEDAEIHEDFLDLQAETTDAQLAEVEDAKDTARLSEFGCLNGGSSCDDASSEPEDPFDAPSSESIGVRSSGAIDIPSVLYSAEQRATSIVEELEKESSYHLAHREEARDEYRSARKANEREFQDKVNALNQEHADHKKSLRARVQNAVRNQVKTHVADWVKRQVRSSIRSNMTEDRAMARENRQSAKLELRAERRAQQRLIDKVFKDSMGSYNRFSRKLMKARFTKNILPKVRKMMAADVQKSLTLLDLAGGHEERAAAQIVNDKGFKGIDDIPSMRFYITERARSKVMPHLEQHFKKLRGDLWAKLGAKKSHMKTSLVSAVGGVPHVGQTISAVVPNTVDDVYGVIKHAVNTSLNHVRDNMATKLTESIANPIMDILTPKLRSGESLDHVSLPKAQELAAFARQSKLLQTQSVLANWGNGLKHAQAEAKNQEAELMKDAYDEAKLVLADIRADNELSVEVLDAQ